MLSISPNKMRQISDPIIDLLEQLHRIISITQVDCDFLLVFLVMKQNNTVLQRWLPPTDSTGTLSR